MKIEPRPGHVEISLENPVETLTPEAAEELAIQLAAAGVRAVALQFEGEGKSVEKKSRKLHLVR